MDIDGVALLATPTSLVLSNTTNEKHRTAEFYDLTGYDDGGGFLTSNLLVFPFGDGDPSTCLEIDEAAKDLAELSCVLHNDYSPASYNDSFGVLTFDALTIDRLPKKQWLNDTLIDFWFQWIWRHCDKSNIHLFPSLFFTTMKMKGVKDVVNWTKKHGVDIFTKKLIFIPVNDARHWSLCVVLNPGAIVQYVEKLQHSNDSKISVCLDDAPFPCLLHFDSFNLHDTERLGNSV